MSDLSKDQKVDAGDLRSLQYFWEEKDDLERSAMWTKLQPALREQYPEILKAWSDYKASRTIVTAVIQHAVDRAERSEYGE